MTSRIGRLRTALIIGVGILLTGLGILAYATDTFKQLGTGHNRHAIRGSR